MWKTHLFTTSGHIILVILVTAFVITFGCLSCYREEEPMPVIVESDESGYMNKPRGQTVDEGQDMQDSFSVPKEEKPKLVPEPNQRVVLSKPNEKMVAEQQRIVEVYTIQVAAFRTRRRAEQLVEKLKTDGYQAYICPRDSEKQGRWYRVFVGNFGTKEQAALLLPRLKNKFEDSFIRFYRLSADN